MFQEISHTTGRNTECVCQARGAKSTPGFFQGWSETTFWFICMSKLEILARGQQNLLTFHSDGPVVARPPAREEYEATKTVLFGFGVGEKLKNCILK